MNSECKYCNQGLEPMELFGRIVGYKQCTCDATQAEAEEAQRKEALRKEEEKREARLQRYSASGIRMRFIGADCECDAYVDKVLSGEGLYIDGKVGSGKTYLASAISKKLIDKGKGLRFMTSVEALSKIRATYDNGQSEEEVIRRLCTCGVLVLDDLGKENQSQTGWVDSMLFRIINERYADMMPIIVTTQFTPAELIKRLSRNSEETATAIVSRLLEMCHGIHLKEEDRRIPRHQK